MSYNGSTSRFIEPPIQKVGGPVANGRWTWWFSAIADAMIRNPDKKIKDIAVMLNKHPNTISMIINTDLFKEYLAQRKEAWRHEHDHALRAKMTDVASEGLDIILEQLKAKRTQIPLNAALKVTESALDRLGYAPASAPTVVVDNSVHDNRQQTVQVAGLSAKDLEEARAALRLSEQTRIGTSLPQALAVDLGLEQGAGHVSDVEAQDEEVLSDPSS
jgi:hypothetical protein